MAFKALLRILAPYLLAIAAMLLAPLAYAIYVDHFADPFLYPQPPATFAFALTFFIVLALAGLCHYFGRKSQGMLFRKEGVFAVVLIWTITPMLGSLPFIISGTLEDPVHAFFEATSGFTTTGASVLTAKSYDAEGIEIPKRVRFQSELIVDYSFFGNIKPILHEDGRIHLEGLDAVNRAILFWRSMMQWLGGLGIVVLFVAVLPALGVGGKMLFHSEMTGPLKESLTPRIKETAMVLWKMYLGLTVVQVGMLLLFNPSMPIFNAVCTTFSTISTGGFSVVNGSIGGYNSPSVEWIVILFMILGSINFSLYYYILKGKFFRLYDLELGVFLVIVLISGIFISAQLVGTTDYFTSGAVGSDVTLSKAIRAGFFQAISAQTSTGFATANFDKWPYNTQTLMLILIYIGGMAGSTAGGMKVIRHIILFRVGQNKVESLFRPEAVKNLRIGQRSIDMSVAVTVLCFFLVVVALAVLGTFLLTLDGLDQETALAVISSTINNSGMGFRAAGPTDSFTFLSDFGMILSSLWMIMGRLEFFTVLVILVPSFWRND